MKTVTVGRLDLVGAIRYSTGILGIPNGEKVQVDFRGLSHCEPLAMTYFAAALRRANVSALHDPSSEAWQYAAHMRFFEAAGVEHPAARAKARANSRYSPLQRIDVADIISTATKQGRDTYKVLSDRAKSLAGILSQSESGDVFETIAYSLKEAMRNVFEHSEQPKDTHLWTAAQYWPYNHRVEVAVLDEGIGVARSLRHNPSLHYSSPQEAIELALSPGVSSNATGPDSVNSGYGLFVMQRLSRDWGTFSFISSGALRSYSGAEEVRGDAPLEGTALRLVFDTEKITGTEERISEIVKSGEDEARRSVEPRNTNASSSSKTI